MDSIDITSEELWRNAMDEEEEDGIEQEIARREREEDEAENDENRGVEENGAVDDDALASLQNLKRDGTAKPRVSRPRPKLDGIRLTGDRGLTAIMDAMKKQKWKGKGHEADDLKHLMMIYEHWGHRMFPKMRFDDIIQKVEDLGRKRTVQSYVQRIRLDMPLYTGTTGDVKDDDDDVRRMGTNFDDEDDEEVAGVLSAGILDEQWERLINSEPTVQVRTEDLQPVSNAENTSIMDESASQERLTEETIAPDPDTSTATQRTNAASDIQSASMADVTASVLSPDVAARIAANRERALERRRQRQLNNSAGISNPLSQL